MSKEYEQELIKRLNDLSTECSILKLKNQELENKIFRAKSEMKRIISNVEDLEKLLG